MEIERPRRSPTLQAVAVAAAAATMVSVFGDDDLLREVLLRVGLTTSLLRAAMVCKRWYRHVSDGAFLRRFRARQPPRLLGIYLSTADHSLPRFFPIRPLPELAAAARRAGSFFDAAFRGSSAFVRDSRGGRLLVTTTEENYGHLDSTELVCSPLSPAGDDTVIVPQPPAVELTGGGESTVYLYGEFLPVNGGGDGRSYSCVLIGYGQRQTTVRLYELQDMCWVARASAAAAELSLTPSRLKVMLLDESKFYILSSTNKILVCDFPSSRITAMDLPNGVEESDGFFLSRGDGSGIFLIHVKGPLLRVFHGRTEGNWALVDTICLRKVCADLVGITAWESPVAGDDAGVKIHAAGDGAKYVFLELFGAVVFLDIATTQAEKVYEIRPEDEELFRVWPLAMTWPQLVFPVVKE